MSAVGATPAGRRFLRASIALISALVLLRIIYVGSLAGRLPAGEFEEWARMPDSGGYLLLAQDLADLSMDHPSYRMPGYPLVIALVDASTGGGGIPGTLILQQVTDGLIALMVLLGAGRMMGRAALAPALAYLLHPYSLAFSARILPSTMTGLFVTAPSLLLLHRRLPSAASALAAGLLISAGIMFRPMLSYASIILCICLLAWNRGALKRAAVPVAVLLAASALLPTAMRIYNARAFGMDAISLQGSFETAGRIAVMTGHVRQEDVFRDGGFRDSLESLAMRDGRLDYAARDSIYRETAVTLLRENPWPVVRGHLLGWAGFLQLGNVHAGYLRAGDGFVSSPVNRLIQLAILLSNIVMFPGIILGMVVRDREGVGRLCGLAASWFVYSAAVHGPLCGPNYALPFMPVWLAAGFAGWSAYLRHRRRRAVSRGKIAAIQ